MATPTNRQQFKDYCLQNKYTKWYFTLIEKSCSRNWNKKTAPVYVEGHHIIPNCITKNKDVVYLTAREHFICHLLLTKMLDGSDKYKMQIAYLNLSNTRNIKTNSKLYESIKKEYSLNCSIYLSGVNNPMYGKTNKGYIHTEEHKIYMKNKMSGVNNPMYGKKYPEHLVIQRSKLYNFVYNGEEVVVFNLRKFCRDNNLDQGAMTRVNSGKQKTHKGYSKWQQ